MRVAPRPSRLNSDELAVPLRNVLAVRGATGPLMYISTPRTRRFHHEIARPPAGPRERDRHSSSSRRLRGLPPPASLGSTRDPEYSRPVMRTGGAVDGAVKKMIPHTVSRRSVCSSTVRQRHHRECVHSACSRVRPGVAGNSKRFPRTRKLPLNTTCSTSIRIRRIHVPSIGT